jgi:hypothetical protein
MLLRLGRCINTSSLMTSWWVKLPLKIKIFLWFLKKGVILTKDNLAKRNWQGSKYCCFCSNFETIQHMFLSVIMLNFFGIRCIWCLALPHHVL